VLVDDQKLRANVVSDRLVMTVRSIIQNATQRPTAKKWGEFEIKG
jgi:hypothetical protein